ncbi:MAG: synthase subunit epsilon [Nevskia sp.]|nr:synthase subunit epsilon [Nevskia sp.]
MATISVDIVSVEGQIHHGEAAMVFAPAEMGELGILPRHAPLLTRLKPGAVRVRDADGTEHSFFVGGGILEVLPHLVTVMADMALRAKDCDEKAAAAAKARAEKMMAYAKTETDIARAQFEMIQAQALAEFLQKAKKGHT